MKALAGGKPKCAWGLYVILDRDLSGLSHEVAAERALAGGAKVLQLRDKSATFEALVVTGKKLRKMTRTAGATLIVNDNPYLAHEIGADGVHVGQTDFPPYIAREILGPDAIIGISTHNKPQALLALTQPVNYIAVGPVFDTQTKPSDNKPLGVEHVRWVKQQLGMPMVAIGGITAGNIPDLARIGIENIAVIREVMTAGDIESKVRELNSLIDSSRLAN